MCLDLCLPSWILKDFKILKEVSQGMIKCIKFCKVIYYFYIHLQVVPAIAKLRIITHSF